MFDTARQIPLFPPDEPSGAEPVAGAAPSVRVSHRARRLSIMVYPRGRVEVVVPRRTRPSEVEAFVAENREWIRKARESFAHDHPPEAAQLPGRIDLRGIGLSVRVHYACQPRASSVRYRYADGLLMLRGRTVDHELCLRAIRRWLAALAREEFAPRLARLSQLTGISYGSMHVRAQRTCWGSRSSGGTISLNLCLLFLDPLLLRYLMLHELCHGRHMNHSKRFWNLLKRYEPDCRRLDRALTESWREVPVWLGLY